jgi:peroxiredoxin
MRAAQPVSWISAMRHFILFAALLFCTSSWALTGEELAGSSRASLVGSVAPALSFKTIDGKTIDLGRLYGKKAVYLKFWATWCTPCREQMPHFERTFEHAGPDLAVVAVNIGFDDSLEAVRKYQSEQGITMPIAIDDGRLASAFKLRVTPQHIVIGRDGRIQYVGHLADARLDAALLAAQKPPATIAHGVPLPKAAPAYDIGDRLPDLTADTLGGPAFRLRDSNAKRPTALVFLSPSCEVYLAKSRPKAAARCRSVREQADAMAADGRVRVLGVGQGLWASKDDLDGYRSGYKVAIPLTFDESGDLFRAFNVKNVPTVLIADAQGRIVRRIGSDDADLAAELQAVLKP